MMEVTFLGHSGFLVEMDAAYLLFDFYKGSLENLNKDKGMFVFVSHAHFDHYKKDIFMLRNTFKQIYFILSDDVKAEGNEDTVFIQANDEKQVGGAIIRTLRSTDEGVAFVVKYEGRTIYHAGDLNWWHWAGEGQVFNTMMSRNYQHEMSKIENMEIDAAFVPVDSRLKKQTFWGLDCFMKKTRTKHVFPMHFWEDYAIFDRLMTKEENEGYRDRICRIEREGQVFRLM